MPNLEDPLDPIILNHLAPQLFKICIQEQILSKRSNRKMATEKLRINYKTLK